MTAINLEGIHPQLQCVMAQLPRDGGSRNTKQSLDFKYRNIWTSMKPREAKRAPEGRAKLRSLGELEDLSLVQPGRAIEGSQGRFEPETRGRWR